jgi:DNA-binding HxlR family transcriptional regulator
MTQTLRHLERDGLIARHVFAVVPPRVEYQLTPLGETALEPLQIMCQWAERHWEEVLAARRIHEAETLRSDGDSADLSDR